MNADTRKLVELAERCLDADAAQEESIIRTQGIEITRYLRSGSYAASSARIRQLSLCKACLQMVTEMIPADWGYMLSRGPNGQVLASVFCPDLDDETTMGGKSEALALLGALALAIAETLNSDSSGPASARPRG